MNSRKASKGVQLKRGKFRSHGPWPLSIVPNDGSRGIPLPLYPLSTCLSNPTIASLERCPVALQLPSPSVSQSRVAQVTRRSLSLVETCENAHTFSKSEQSRGFL